MLIMAASVYKEHNRVLPLVVCNKSNYKFFTGFNYGNKIIEIITFTVFVLWNATFNCYPSWEGKIFLICR